MKSAYIHWHSYGIWKIPHIAAFLSPDFVPCFFHRHADVVIGWGNRPTTKKARQMAAQKGVPFIALEDGFLRSLGLGDEPPLSLCVDDLGIYYDIATPSRLEEYILSREKISQEDEQQARQAIDLIIQDKISKYNLAPNFRLPETQFGVSQNNQPKVLLIDQTYGDMSIAGAKSDENTFKQMFQAACEENPNAHIIVKTHPDVFSGKRQGYLTEIAKKQGVTLLYDKANPIDLLQQVDKVYCVCSHMGFEALIRHKKVHCYGLPFYAGWGLTTDEIACERRTRRLELWQLVWATLCEYPLYIHPKTQQFITAETAALCLLEQKQNTGGGKIHRNFFSRNFGKIKQLFKVLLMK